MCGRFVRKDKIAAIAKRFAVEEVDCELAPSHNVAPTQQVAVVVQDPERRLVAMRWGLIPWWAEDLKIGNRHINARAESLATKPAFKDSFIRRRCLVVANGFFEWKKIGKSRTPLYIHLKSDELFAFAGLYDRWKTPDGERITSCTIITTDPNELVLPIHDRMPVILARKMEDAWLEPETVEEQKLLAMLKPYNADEMAAYEVSDLVNSPANDSPQCIEPGARPDQPGLF
jgi:putative SOS response-associated peptidase YedK